MNKFTQKGLSLLLFIALCLAAGLAGAEDDLLWPLEQDLVIKGIFDDDEDAWGPVGEVRMWNTPDNLHIEVTPDMGFRLEEVNIHITLDDGESFSTILDKKGKPIIRDFDYKTDDPDPYQFTLEFPLHGELATCWGIPEKCPIERYIIVHAELSREDPDTGKWVDMDESAFAFDDKTFNRTDKEQISGGYTIYPLAKIETGHFVDAKVKGLTYLTPTQDGVTGNSGDFDYIPGERADFWVGNAKLGNALAGRNVTPYDLYFDDAPMDDDQALNVAWLLQNLGSDASGEPSSGPIVISDEVIGCLNQVLADTVIDYNPGDFSDIAAVEALIGATIDACGDLETPIVLTLISRDAALANLERGQRAANIVKKNISKTPDMLSDKAKIEIMPVYVPAQRSDDTLSEVEYYDEEGEIIETRGKAKPIVVSYVDEVEGTGAMDVFVAISKDDGDTWKRRNISKTAGQMTLANYPGESWKPILKVKDNKIFVAWTDKYCRGGRPGYAITVCPDTTGDGIADPCEVCRTTDEGTFCSTDYDGDDAYWQDDLFGVGGPQKTVLYEEAGEVPYSCVWTARGVVDEISGKTQWFKPERLTSGRRDAFQIFAGAGQDVAFAIVWQEDPKGLVPGDGEGPGEGWSGSNTNNKTDVWYSYIKMDDFDKIDEYYPTGGHGDNGDIVDTDLELQGRVKALVPMSLPVRITDNEVCSAENMDPDGGQGDHDYDGEGEGTHRYCGEVADIGDSADSPGSNPLCAYTFAKTNPSGEVHNVCVTADNRLLDGNTGASRPNIFLQPYKKADGSKSAWVIIGYEESKGVGSPPDGEHDDDSCGTATDSYVTDVETEEHDDDRYKPDMGKNVIYHSFDLSNPVTVSGGGIINLPETDSAGNPVYLVDETGADLLDWKGDKQFATENARRVRFVTQPKSKAGDSGTVLVTLYRQGEEGSGKPADIFMRSIEAPATGNPYAFNGFRDEAQNVSSVEPDVEYLYQEDLDAPVKMLRWSWTPDNLADSSAQNPYSDSRAHRGALNGDELIIGYSWTPNWGRRANDKYDLYIRRSFNGGQGWTTDPNDEEPIEHNVVFRNPVFDEETQTITWEDEVVTTTYEAGAAEPPRNVSNLRNNRITVAEPRLVKTPGTILTDGVTLYPEDKRKPGTYQLAYGLDFNQNQLPVDVEYPKLPLDIYYSRTTDKGQRYKSVIVTPQSGSGKPQEGWNPLAQDKPEQGAAQLRQTPDGSRMYGIWLEQGQKGSDIMFRRVDYR